MKFNKFQCDNCGASELEAVGPGEHKCTYCGTIYFEEEKPEKRILVEKSISDSDEWGVLLSNLLSYGGCLPVSGMILPY
jgi:rubredoxin